MKILNFLDACDFLNLKPSELYRLVLKNKIPYFSPTGKNIYFNKEKLKQ